MTDIDTIREALLESQQIVGAFKAQYDAAQSIRNALAALERVSALQAEMIGCQQKLIISETRASVLLASLNTVVSVLNESDESTSDRCDEALAWAKKAIKESR